MVDCTRVARAWRAALAAGLLAAGLAGAAQAQDKVSVTTTWFAQAEHGGIYQAVANGIYKKYGLDVTVKMGGPQVNGMQLLLAGQSDFIMNYDFAVLSSVEKGFPVVTIAAPFQFDIQGIMTRDDVPNLGALKDKTILVAGTGTTYWWPWVKKKYGYTDAQMRPYTFNLQPFFNDPNIVQQAFPSSEPYQADQKGVKTKFFLLSAEGYPPYTQAISTTQKMISEKPDVVARFVKASLEGWKSYMEDPAPGNVLIKKDNPNMTDEQIAYSVSKLKEMGIIGSGDARTAGIGTLNESRIRQNIAFLQDNKIVEPGKIKLEEAFKLDAIKATKVLP